MMTKSEEKMYLKDEVATKIFTSSECFNYTASVISATLGLDLLYVKENLTILDPKISKNIHDKGTVVDAIFTHDDFTVNIEINYGLYDDTLIKNTIYLAQLLIRQTKVGDEYTKTNKVIQININNYDLYKKGEFIYKSYIMDDKYHIKRDELIEIYDINIDYLSELGYNEVKKLNINDLRYLLYIFVCSDEKVRIKLYNENLYMKEVFTKMNELTQETDGILYYNRKKFLEKAAYNQGVKDGEKSGEQRGEQRKEQEIVKSMLEDDMPIEDISKYTKLSVSRIKDIIKNK